jgi:hypothetical protein
VVEVAKIPFDAAFYFKDGGLRQVSLAVSDRSFKDSLERFTAVRKYLTGEYGKEDSAKSNSGVVNLEEAEWVRGDRKIVLLLMGVLTNAVLFIHYQAEPGEPPADGLPRPKPDQAEENKRYLTAREKAEKGDADAQVDVATRLSAGLGVEKNQTEALQWYRKAAGQNHVKAQAMLGGCYFSGIGVAKDPTEAVKWLRQAAGQGDALAQNALGFSYATGQGVQEDDTEAIQWYRKAADQGYDQAQYNMGYCHENGLGVAKNDTAAVKWYRKAAEQNYTEAQFHLGRCYLAGRGLAKDEVEACKWLLLAGAQGHEAAKQNMTTLAPQLTREQLAEGRQRASAFKLPGGRQLAGISIPPAAPPPRSQQREVYDLLGSPPRNK